MITRMNAQEIKARQENQQDRIAQGVNSGQLTAGETANLEHKEAKLNREIRHDRKQNGGNLTNKEKRQINRQQNRLSRQIYRDKHNARHQ
jgi:metal-dependent amidase/aminoacylase/carboxypeptidase family protein